MSRAFVDEDKHEEPKFVPPRAPLPEGTSNYVTENGLKELEEELEEWEQKLQLLLQEEEKDERENRLMINFINDSMSLLRKRIATAEVVSTKPRKDIRFGAKITLKIGNTAKQTLQIVGVDEADVKKKKIAFTSPLARAIIGKKEGEYATLHLGGEARPIKILKISY